MKKHSILITILLNVILIITSVFNNPLIATTDQLQNDENITLVNESRMPLSYFNIYRGNSHAHTIFTWTHGPHRVGGISNLSRPTIFNPEWQVPPGVDWTDHKTINFNPEYYVNIQGLPDNHFQLAIDNGYDFYAVTDHSQEPTLQPVSVNNHVWQLMLTSAEKFNNHPGFVALVGFEYSRNTTEDGGSGHVNVINSAQYVNADHGQRGPAPEWPAANWNIPLFYDWVKSAKPYNNKGDIVVHFNHPQIDQYNDWDHIDDEIVELISNFELHTNYNRIRWDAYVRALNKGWKVSPIGVHDNHSYEAISDPNNPPPTFVLAPELTREAITRAMKQRRTYVSWLPEVEVRYAVNGYFMGSTLPEADTYNFNIEIKSRPDQPEEKIRRIQVLRNNPKTENVEVAAELLVDGSNDIITWTPTIQDAASKFFLLRVHHQSDIEDDGSFKAHVSTVSAPVWTGK
jgi:hypothetical protein